MHRVLYRLAFSMLILACTQRCLGQGRIIQITFDTGRPPFPSGVTAYNETSYYEPGFSFNSRYGSFMRRLSGSPVFPDNGSSYVQAWDAAEYFLYSEPTRGFDLISVDLAPYSATNLTPAVVRFVALDNPSVIPRVIAETEFTVIPVLDTQGRLTFQTFYFPVEFRNVYYLSITSNGRSWSLDNLVIYVPEPSAWALFLSGGGTLLWVLRHRANRASFLPPHERLG